jgi:predicted RNase H-like nuclease
MYPGGAQDVWKVRRKQYGLGHLRRGLRRLGIGGITDDMTHDELDAVSGAYVGVLYLRGRAELIGDERTGGILLPYPAEGAA